MTLAGVECEQYTVTQGRIEGTKAHVLQPNWEEIKGLEECNSEKRLKQIWIRAWKVLNWKHRPAKHHEAYWRMLHKRPWRANNFWGCRGKGIFHTESVIIVGKRIRAHMH